MPLDHSLKSILYCWNRFKLRAQQQRARSAATQLRVLYRVGTVAQQTLAVVYGSSTSYSRRLLVSLWVYNLHEYVILVLQ
jgi:hypothetical protein